MFQCRILCTNFGWIKPLGSCVRLPTAFFSAGKTATPKCWTCRPVQFFHDLRLEFGQALTNMFQGRFFRGNFGWDGLSGENACVPMPVIIQVQQVSCSRASGQSLGFLPKGDADAIGYLSTKVSYPGSKADLSSVEQHYLTANTWSNVAHELDAIARKQDIYSDAQAGRWTYPGWRVDVFKGIVDRYVSSDDTPLPERVRELLDHKQQAFQTSPPSMQASAWTSLTSHIGRYGSFDVACFVMIGFLLSFYSYTCCWTLRFGAGFCRDSA